MRLRFLLVNPWICDFAAYNLWAKPLGLFRVAEYLSRYDIEIRYINCLFTEKRKHSGTGKYRAEPVLKPDILSAVPRTFKRYGISTSDFRNLLDASLPCDAVFVTSVMTYWYPGVQTVIELIRKRDSSVPVILGGIYAILCGEHAAACSGADFIYRGTAGAGIDIALRTFGFRPRNKGKSLSYSQMPVFHDDSFAPILTSSGCPFRCSYCASDILCGTYKRTPPNDTADEILRMYARGVRDFAFYDDALLFEAGENIKPVLRMVTDSGIRARFHTPNGLHARFIDAELAGLMRKSGFATIRLGLETVSDDRQKRTGGKVDTDHVVRAVDLLRKQGYTGKEIGVYLMYGMPGQEPDEVVEGVRFLKGLGVRICLTEFSPIRHTRCWQELVGAGVIDDMIDPLLTNNTVFPLLFAGYEARRIGALKIDISAYNASLTA